MTECDFPRCKRAAVFIGEDRHGTRVAVCEADRPSVRWSWLKRLSDSAFPDDPNAGVLSYEGVSR